VAAVAGGYLVLRGRARLLELTEALQQDPDPLGALRVVAGRMELGERGVTYQREAGRHSGGCDL
jgi:hypothetical protein